MSVVDTKDTTADSERLCGRGCSCHRGNCGEFLDRMVGGGNDIAGANDMVCEVQGRIAESFHLTRAVTPLLGAGRAE